MKGTQKALDDFHQAAAKLGQELAKALRLRELADWLTKYLNRLLP